MSGATHEVLRKTIDDRSNRDMHGEAKILRRKMKSFVFICFYLIKLFWKFLIFFVEHCKKKKNHWTY